MFITPLIVASALLFLSTHPRICIATSDPLSYANRTDELTPITSDNEVNIDQPPAEHKNVILDINLRWPNAIIPYVISSTFSQSDRNIIAKAMLEFHNNTCIRFVPRNVLIHRDYLNIQSTGTGCNSNVGRTGGQQLVSIDQGCLYVGLIIHELMHAAGFYHEQCRTDRDDYVVVNWDNIQEGFKLNFNKLGPDVIQYLGAPYDIGSVMHYESTAFAKDRNVPTIYAKNGGVLGNSKGFSPIDIMKLNRLYQCNASANNSVIATTDTPIGTGMPITVTVPIGPTVAGPCVDVDASLCTSWFKTYQCLLNPNFMNIFCKQTCGQCTLITSPAPKLQMVCSDLDIVNCPFWAQNEQCTANPMFMLINCQQSCNVCFL